LLQTQENPCWIPSLLVSNLRNYLLNFIALFEVRTGFHPGSSCGKIKKSEELVLSFWYLKQLELGLISVHVPHFKLMKYRPDLFVFPVGLMRLWSIIFYSYCRCSGMVFLRLSKLLLQDDHFWFLIFTVVSLFSCWNLEERRYLKSRADWSLKQTASLRWTLLIPNIYGGFLVGT
jgi:hypothetical protein